MIKDNKEINTSNEIDGNITDTTPNGDESSDENEGNVGGENGGNVDDGNEGEDERESMLVVGENTYFTLEEADKIMSGMLSTSTERKIWEGLSDDDKESLIINSHELYDSDAFNYKGTKVDKDQPLQFPRIIGGKEVEAPYKIKKGILLNGLVALDIEVSSSTESALKKMGIHSFSDGSGASITFESDSSSKSEASKLTGIYDNIWDAYFRDYCDIGRIGWL